jgi:hypothetical protein
MLLILALSPTNPDGGLRSVRWGYTADGRRHKEPACLMRKQIWACAALLDEKQE